MDYFLLVVVDFLVTFCGYVHCANFKRKECKRICFECVDCPDNPNLPLDIGIRRFCYVSGTKRCWWSCRECKRKRSDSNLSVVREFSVVPGNKFCCNCPCYFLLCHFVRFRLTCG